MADDRKRVLSRTPALPLGIAVTMAGVCSIAFALSRLQPPAPAPSEAGQNEQRLDHNKAGDGAGNDRVAQSRAAALDQENPKETNRPDSDSGDQQQRKSPAGGWDFINAGLMLLFTGALTFVAFLQWLAMREQARHMRDGLAVTGVAAGAAKKSADAAEQALEQMRLEQRAWIGAIFTLGELQATQLPDAKLVVRNTGATPGTIETIRCNGVVAPVATAFPHILIHHTAAQDQRRQTVVPPNQKVSLWDTTSIVPALSEEDFRAITEGTKTIYLLATITYIDAMNRRHETGCCFVYNAAAKCLSLHDQQNYMT